MYYTVVPCLLCRDMMPLLRVEQQRTPYSSPALDDPSRGKAGGEQVTTHY